jgi:hypothetical protein
MTPTPRRLLFGGATLVSCVMAGLAAAQPMPQATPVAAPRHLLPSVLPTTRNRSLSKLGD